MELNRLAIETISRLLEQRTRRTGDSAELGVKASVLGAVVQALLAVLLEAGQLRDQFGHVARAFA